MSGARKLLAGGTPPREVAQNLGSWVPTLYQWIPAGRSDTKSDVRQIAPKVFRQIIQKVTPMTITVSVPDQLAQQAAARGLSVEALVEQLAEQAAQSSPEPNWTRLGSGPLTPEQAVDDLREARKGVTLGGLKIKDLVHEGHKY